MAKKIITVLCNNTVKVDRGGNRVSEQCCYPVEGTAGKTAICPSCHKKVFLDPKRAVQDP